MYFFSLYVVTCTYFSRMRKRTAYLYIKIEEREVYKIQQLLKVYTTRHGQPCAKSETYMHIYIHNLLAYPMYMVVMDDNIVSLFPSSTIYISLITVLILINHTVIAIRWKTKLITSGLASYTY